jgi:predicted RNase H-like HicB family nuclease
MDISWDPRSDTFVVAVSELDGCLTHGRTYDEAARQGREAIETWVDAERGLGLPIPEPRTFDREVANRWWVDGQESQQAAQTDDGDCYPPYSMILEWDPRSDIFIVTVPEFRGARTHGNTYEQAAAMGREVIESLVDIARQDGEDLPRLRTFQPRRVRAVT